MCFALYQLRQHLRYALHGFDDEGDSELFSKRLREIELRAGRTIWPDDECGRAVARDNTEFTDLENLVEATGSDADAFCTACLSGAYPTDVPMTDGKFLLERTP